MRQLYLVTILSFLYITALKAQTIDPVQTGEFCPETEYTFTVNIPKAFSSIVAVGGSSITQLPASPVGLTFTFKGRFADINAKQSFKVTYTDQTNYSFDFLKIKSLFYSSNAQCSIIQPFQPSFNAPLCQITTQTINFNTVSYTTAFENPVLCFGNITNYEYQLPAGWSIGTNNSTGNNWIVGSNNVSITSDLSTGGSIKIRPSTTACGALQNNSTIYFVPIVRNTPTYTLSPSAFPFKCGDASAKTFTITQNGTFSGTPSYTWNLGNNNGWLYQGNPAPAVLSTGTSNSIVLTPDCINSPKNFDATVSINCLTLNTNNTGFFTVANSPAIVGQKYVCSPFAPQPYSISELPCDAVVNWSVSPTGPVSLSNSTGATTNANYVSDGVVTLTANITSANCGNYTRFIQINSGGRQSNTGTYTQSYGYFNPIPFQTYVVFPTLPPATPVELSIDGSGVTFVSFYSSSGSTVNWSQINTNTARIITYPDETITGYVYAYNECGKKIYNNFYMRMGNPARGSFDTTDSKEFSVSPNPASNTISVSSVSLTNNKKVKQNAGISKIEIYGKMGVIVRKLDFKTPSFKTNIDISNLKNDTYLIRLFYGNKWETHKLIKTN